MPMTTAPPPLSLIVPVFNEAGALPLFLVAVEKLAGRLADGSEIIVVDDGSTDGTSAALAEAEHAWPLIDSVTLRLVRHRRNRGYGAALRSGLEAAHNDVVAICDADGTYPLMRVPALAAQLGDDADMVVGARPLSDSPLLRRPAKAALNAFASYLAASPIPDLNSGLRVFRRADWRRHAHLMPDGFSFTSTITMALLTEGRSVLYVPIRCRPREGHSKIRPIRDTAAFFLLVCRMALMFRPLRVFGPAATVLAIAGLGLLVARLFMDDTIGVATTIVLLVASMQLFALGLLAELINRRSVR